MKVEAKAYKVKERKNSVIGFAQIVIDDSFVVQNIVILEGERGKFISFPTKKDESLKKGYSDIAYPITKEAREQIQKTIIEAYDALE